MGAQSTRVYVFPAHAPGDKPKDIRRATRNGLLTSVSQTEKVATRILFVCVHNAGRSQMAEALLNHLARKRGLDVIAESAGTVGGKALNPQAVEAVAELGITMDGHGPKLLTQAMADRADRIISMGCGVDAEACPAKFLLTEDWQLDDPAGRSLDDVRSIRDQIVDRVNRLLDELSINHPR